MHGETPGEYDTYHGTTPAMAPAAADPWGVPSSYTQPSTCSEEAKDLRAEAIVRSYTCSQQVVRWALEEAKALRADAIAEKAEGSALPPGEFCFHTATAKVARRRKRVNKLTALCASIRTPLLYEAVRDGVCQGTQRHAPPAIISILSAFSPSDSPTLCCTRCCLFFWCFFWDVCTRTKRL